MQDIKDQATSTTTWQIGTFLYTVPCMHCMSAGGVADHFVTQPLRQGDSAVFKRYSQAKLNMMREALAKPNRGADEQAGIFSTV